MIEIDVFVCVCVCVCVSVCVCVCQQKQLTRYRLKEGAGFQNYLEVLFAKGENLCEVIELLSNIQKYSLLIEQQYLMRIKSVFVRLRICSF